MYPYRDALETVGHTVTSRWLREREEATYANVTEQYRLACALDDIHDVRSSELVVLDTFDVTPRGGREFEMGVAITLGIPVIVVGPFRNVFHRLAWKHFEGDNAWTDVVNFLKNVKRD